MAKNTKTTAVAEQSSIAFESLRTWNSWQAGLLALQGVVILLLSVTKVFPIQTSYVTVDPLSTQIAGSTVLGNATRHLFDLNLAYLVALFFFVSAIAHAVIATVYRKRYETDLKKKINTARWVEYAFSAGTMLVSIAVLSGVADFSTLVLLFVLVMVASFMGLVMEIYASNSSKAGSNRWLCKVATLAGIVPWLVVAFYVYGSNAFGGGGVPGFVYGVYVTMIILFGGFVANMYLLHRKTGRWNNYLYGERWYMILSFAAKTLLAWQIFAGVLKP